MFHCARARGASSAAAVVHCSNFTISSIWANFKTDKKVPREGFFMTVHIGIFYYYHVTHVSSHVRVFFLSVPKISLCSRPCLWVFIANVCSVQLLGVGNEDLSLLWWSTLFRGRLNVYLFEICCRHLASSHFEASIHIFLLEKDMFTFMPFFVFHLSFTSEISREKIIQ